MDLTSPRNCARCGQPIDMRKDSYNYPDAGGAAHVTCPASAAIRALSAAEPVESDMEASQPSIRFLTMDDAASLIKVSKDTIRRRIRAGDLPAKRLRGGQTVLIDQRDVLALLEDVREAA